MSFLHQHPQMVACVAVPRAEVVVWFADRSRHTSPDYHMFYDPDDTPTPIKLVHSDDVKAS